MKYFKISLDAKINHISSGLLNTQGNFSHPSRTLNHFVLLCGLKNKFEISIGEAIFKLEPGVCLLLPPNVRHAICRASKVNTPSVLEIFSVFVPTLPVRRISASANAVYPPVAGRVSSFAVPFTSMRTDASFPGLA